jgi:hypothetical protein
MLLGGILAVAVVLCALWIWAARLGRARPESRRSILLVVVGASLGAGIPLVLAIVSMVVVMISSKGGGYGSTLIAEAVARGVRYVGIAGAVLLAGAATFAVMALRRRRRSQA